MRLLCSITGFAWMPAVTVILLFVLCVGCAAVPALLALDDPMMRSGPRLYVVAFEPGKAPALRTLTWGTDTPTRYPMTAEVLPDAVGASAGFVLTLTNGSGVETTFRIKQQFYAPGGEVCGPDAVTEHVLAPGETCAQEVRSPHAGKPVGACRAVVILFRPHWEMDLTEAMAAPGP